MLMPMIALLRNSDIGGVARPQVLRDRQSRSSATASVRRTVWRGMSGASTSSGAGSSLAEFQRVLARYGRRNAVRARRLYAPATPVVDQATATGPP